MRNYQRTYAINPVRSHFVRQTILIDHIDGIELQESIVSKVLAMITGDVTDFGSRFRHRQ